MLDFIPFIILGLLIYVTSGFILSVALRRNDIADVMWGPGILLVSILAYMQSKSTSLALLFVIACWALRIFLHIGKRFISKDIEDFRYATWRTTWKHFYTRSFLQVFLLQGALMFLVSMSAVMFYLENLTVAMLATKVFLLLALCALVFEAIADVQLTKFLTKRTGGIMQSGVWKYSRHPNYFGEVMFWWCISLAAVSSMSITPMSLLLFISPLTITYLILYVSGIPLLEKKYESNAEFQAYKSRTNAFFPWLPRK